MEPFPCAGAGPNANAPMAEFRPKAEDPLDPCLACAPPPIRPSPVLLLLLPELDEETFPPPDTLRLFVLLNP